MQLLIYDKLEERIKVILGLLKSKKFSWALAVLVGIIIYLPSTPEGLTPEGHKFLALLGGLIVLFLTEPIPFPLIMAGSGVCLILLGIGDLKTVWMAYAHPVVFFILCCLMIAIVGEHVGLTERLGNYLLRKAGTNVVRFSFVICMGLGVGSAFMHDIAATTVGIMVMLPLMRSAKIEPFTNTGLFLMLSLPFCCSAGGMGTLVGGARNMVAVAFLEEFTGETITFFQWFLYAFPGALVTIPLIWFTVYFVLRPDRTLTFPVTEEQLKTKPWTAAEIKCLTVVIILLATWFTSSIHGIHYSVTGMAAVIILFMMGLMPWKEFHDKVEWAVCILVFGGGIALGLAMEYSGTGNYLASIFFPYFEGKGWLVLFIGVGIFGALITNVMANVAAAALILPIAIPLSIQMGVDPTIMALCLGMMTSYAYLLIIGCPPNVVAYSFGYFKPYHLLKVGLVCMPVACFTLVVVVNVWWRIIGLI